MQPAMMATPLTRDYLEFQSDRIERVLASHRVPVRVEGGAMVSMTPGITIDPLMTMGGLQSNFTYYDNVRVPKDCLIGDFGFFDFLFSRLKHYLKSSECH